MREPRQALWQRQPCEEEWSEPEPASVDRRRSALAERSGWEGAPEEPMGQSRKAPLVVRRLP